MVCECGNDKIVYLARCSKCRREYSPCEHPDAVKMREIREMTKEIRSLSIYQAMAVMYKVLGVVER